MANTNKKVITRIQNKHDLEVNWKKATGFIPLAGELIIYDIEVDSEGNVLTMVVDGETKPALPAYLPDSTDTRAEPFAYERFKIGDGVTAVNDLAFTVIESERVYFDEDLTVTTSDSETDTIAAAGKNLRQLLGNLWTESRDQGILQTALEAELARITAVLQNAIQDLSNTGSVITYNKVGGTTGSFNTTFVGTRAEYTTAYNAGNIPVGTIVVITDESDDDDTENAGATSAILGQGVLGYLILG